MRYDLEVVEELCREIGLSAHAAGQRVEIDLGQGAILCFENAEREEDCLIGFLDTAWHTHGDLMFMDARRNAIELGYLDVLTGLKEGRVLICEREVEGRTEDRWLIHSECNDEFRYLQEGERIIIRRAAMSLSEDQLVPPELET
jgi:hypothetical protein